MFFKTSKQKSVRTSYLHMPQRFIAACAILSLGVFLLVPDAALAQFGGGRGFRTYGLDSEGRARIAALGDVIVQNLPIPVLLGVELSDITKNFGDPRGDGTRTHEGLDMLAPEGTPIASPTDAVVVRVGDGDGSGLYVRTLNPGGESFVYMHLVAIADNLKAGDALKRGDIVGFVGNTGNASGGPAHLHFEIRKDGAQDPHPRLTHAFTLEERMRGVAQALERGGAGYVSTYASRFRSVFTEARAQGFAVPQAILALLDAGVPATTPPSTTPSADGEIAFGQNNARIVELQKFLIAAASGSDATYLARSGATGYFGPITKAALVEYQRQAGLNASGVVDNETYTLIFALAGEGDSSETEPEENGEVADSSGAVFTFTRDLELGVTGEDVRELQKFLNAQSFLVATSGAGSPGNETNYFGLLTQAALARYQASKNIKPSVGYFGPITRAHLALLIE